VIDPATSLSRIAKTNTRTPTSRNPSPIISSIGLRPSNVSRRPSQILRLEYELIIGRFAPAKDIFVRLISALSRFVSPGTMIDPENYSC
jgi:hypothetical protein